MKFFVLIASSLATSIAFAAGGNLKLTTSAGNTMIEIRGAAAAKLYQDLSIEEDTSGNDEEGAPKATKLGESVFCSKLSAARFYCVMYMDQKTGKITGY